jgi:phytoene dehydrogenase-like protein
MSSSYDAVIIGAGHNGLVTSAYLAKTGKKVLVVERRERIGGIVATEEFAPGFKASVGPDLVGLLHPRVIQDLHLDRHGLDILALDPALFLPSIEGEPLLIWQDNKKTIDEIARHSKADAEAYPRFANLVGRLSAFARPLLTKNAPRPEVKKAGDLLDFLGLGWNLKKLGKENLYQALRIPPMSVADFLEEWFESEPLKACLAAQGLVGCSVGPRSFGTATVFLYHQLGKPGWPLTSWGLPRGGMGSVSEALAKAAEEQGVTIRTETPISRVLVDSGQAQGVVLDNGEEIPARTVVSGTDPKTTFFDLVDPIHFETGFLKKVERIRYRGVTAKLLLALGELPDFICRPGKDPSQHHRSIIQIGASIDYLERAYDDVKYRRPSTRPYLQAVLPSLADPSMAPPGQHVMSVTMQYAPYRLDEGSWSDRKESLANTIIDTLSTYAPNLPNAILHRKIITPQDYDSIYGQPEGSFHHGELNLDQLYFMRPVAGWARYETPIAGLYLCGSGTHPGGGVSGACGYNASRRILKNLA